VFVVVQTFDLDALEVAARHDSKDRIAVNNGQVAKTVVVHLSKRVNGHDRRRNGNWTTCHGMSNWSRLGVSSLGQGPHGIPPSKDTQEPLLVIDNEDGPFPAFPHRAAGFLD
jgi:hypothetical protein